MESPSEHEQQKSKYFDPDKGFLELPIVQICLGILVAACVGVVAIISSTKNLHFRWDADGLVNAATWFRVPVGVFTLSLPVFALLAASHRSEQTKRQMWLTRTQIERTDRQIRLTAGQNNFSNFFKHVEEFEKYCKSHVRSELYEIGASRRLHAILFPMATTGELTLDDDYNGILESRVHHFLRLCDKLGDPNIRASAAYDIRTTQMSFLDKYHFRALPTSGSEWCYLGETFFVAGESVVGFMRYHAESFFLLDEICRFDTGYQTPGILNKLRNSSYRAIPSTDLQSSPEFDTFGLIDSSLEEYHRRISS